MPPATIHQRQKRFLRTLPFHKRFTGAFDETTLKAFGPKYLDSLLAGWRDAVETMRRDQLLIGALVIGFLLLANAKNAAFTLGPLRLTNLSAVLTLTPALVALLGYEWLESTVTQAAYRAAVRELLYLMHPTIVEYNLESFLTPPVIQLMGAVGPSWMKLRTRPRNTWEAVAARTALSILFGLVLGFAVFLVFAYEHLFLDPHADVIAVSVSLGVSLLFVGRSVVVAVVADSILE